jgi:hypothetical protein
MFKRITFKRVTFKHLGLIVLLATVLASPYGTPAQAAGAGAAGAGLSACERLPAGKETRDCVANVLETLAAQQGQPERKAELLRAASGLRAAVNRAQAVLAITACYNVISAALKQASASGKGVRGMGGAEGLGLIAGVVARAVRLIQTKG